MYEYVPLDDPGCSLTRILRQPSAVGWLLDGKQAQGTTTTEELGLPAHCPGITIANSLMLNDADEAKDHTDAIIDLLVRLAASGRPIKDVENCMSPQQEPRTTRIPPGHSVIYHRISCDSAGSSWRTA